MSEEKDNATEIVKEIAKEAYQDGGKAIVKPAGDLGGLLLRTIKAALAPMEKWTLQREYNIAETRKLLEQKLERVSIDSIETPEPYIALPAMQYLSYCMDREELRDMYANLLANSMISVIKDGVHPGFVEIIKQLSPDEAKILKYISIKQIIPIVNLRYQNEKGNGIDVVKDFSNVGEITDCEQKYETGKYFDNLIRLGLIEKSGTFTSLTEKSLYKPLKEHPYLKPYKGLKSYIDQGFSNEIFTEGYMRLTSYGEAFCDICVNFPNVVVVAN